MVVYLVPAPPEEPPAPKEKEPEVELGKNRLDV